ncbi:MAG TPA: hypothetical protein VEB43_06180 [Anaeromyxobacter sp.]|nr:hypothetical protein [Anaeromyxobacter sp.]
MLTNRVQGVSGNVPMELGPPNTTALQVQGMAGGVGCRSGEPCISNANCVSGTCSAARCM